MEIIGDSGDKELVKFQELSCAIEGAGYYTSLDRSDDGRIQGMVCAQLSDEGALRGCSFWVSRENGEWSVFSWDPEVIYMVPDTNDMLQLCVELLLSSECALFAIPDDIVSKYQLKVTWTRKV